MRKLKTFFIAALLLASTAAHAAGLKIIRDEEIERSLQALSKPIFQQAGLSPEAVRFVLVDSHELNAFVAGGQNIFLYTELILQTKSPEELSGVIAHESGHIAGGHLFRAQAEMSNLSMQSILSGLLGVAVAVVSHSPDAGVAISSVGNSVTTREFLRHSRTQEGAADQAGVRFLRGAGMPVTGFLTFMEKLESQELLPDSEQSEYVRTHPVTEDRISFLQRIVDEKPGGAMPTGSVEMHNRIKAKLLGYLFPERALQDNTTSIPAQYGRAIAWMRKGQFEKSRAIVDALLKEEPKNAYFHELKGQLHFENGRVEEASKAYAKAAELAPFSGLIRMAYAHSLLELKTQKAENLSEAIRQLEVVIRQEKRLSEPHRMIAIAYGKLGQEGMSRLHLAEEALMQNKVDFAKREATLALTHLKKGTPAYLRAEDILEAIKKRDGRDQKKG